MNTEVERNLNKILANTFVLYTKTLNYHWHTKGPSFYGLHKLLEEHYESLAKAADSLAEMTVMLGGQALGSLKDFLENTNISESLSVQSSMDTLIEDLAHSHDTMIKTLREIRQALEDADFAAAEDLLVERLAQHLEMKWMLEAHLKN